MTINKTSNGLAPMIEVYMTKYFEALESNLSAGNIYDIVMNEVERPLLEVTLRVCENNQKKAAEVLGINRNTLRRKLNSYDL